MSEDPIELVSQSDVEEDPNEFVETEQQINTSYMENSVEMNNGRRDTNPSSPSKTHNKTNTTKQMNVSPQQEKRK